MKVWLLMSVFIFMIMNTVSAQKYTQIVRGTVFDKEVSTEVIGAYVFLLTKDSTFKATTTDVDGKFRFEEVPIGRWDLKVRMIGYQELFIPQFVVTSAKEVVLEIPLEESLQTLDEVVVTAVDKSQTVNEAILVSGRIFDAFETEKYAGSRQDPARMVANYAGVQGTDDSRNDIVVRGNSPLGVLYRYEGLDIPNPNHFAVVGSMGGPVSMLNNKVMGASDFMTGAYPSEYGNVTSAVFDINMKSGNNEKAEFSAQLGLLGTELFAEGPISKKNRSSYIVAARYSTLKIFESFNFNLGTSAVPGYQDISFKLLFPTKKSGTFSIFGLGGSSGIDLVMSKFTEPQEELYGVKDEDQYFDTRMGITGVSHKASLGERFFSELSVGTSAYRSVANNQYIYRNAQFGIDSMRPSVNNRYTENRILSHYSISYKKSAKSQLKLGILAEALHFDYIDSLYYRNEYVFRIRNKANDRTGLFQSYLQWRYKPSEKIMITTGLHAQYYSGSNSKALEPRFAFRWQINNKQSLGLGYGLHSRTQPYYMYYQKQYTSGSSTNGFASNTKMDFTRSHHFVMTYDASLHPKLRFKAEAYYQLLYNIPVSSRSSSFSMVNVGSGFSLNMIDTLLVNEGTATNYGVEITLEKFYDKHYFALLTATIYNSIYQGSDLVSRPTDYNGNFALHMLAGIDKPVGGKQKNNFIAAFTTTLAGGKRYSPIDTLRSAATRELVEIDSEKNTLQFKNYFRTDIKFGCRINSPKMTHEIALDLLNVLNIKNILRLQYDPDIAATQPDQVPIQQIPQLGFLPVFYYKVDF